MKTRFFNTFLLKNSPGRGPRRAGSSRVDCSPPSIVSPRGPDRAGSNRLKPNQTPGRDFWGLRGCHEVVLPTAACCYHGFQPVFGAIFGAFLEPTWPQKSTKIDPKFSSDCQPFFGVIFERSWSDFWSIFASPIFTRIYKFLRENDDFLKNRPPQWLPIFAPIWAPT